MNGKQERQNGHSFRSLMRHKARGWQLLALILFFLLVQLSTDFTSYVAGRSTRRKGVPKEHEHHGFKEGKPTVKSEWERAQLSPSVNGETSSCIPSGDEKAINDALQSIGSEAVLCKRAVFNISNPIMFTRDYQKLYTVGFPTGNERALISVVDDSVVKAIVMVGRSNVELRNVIVNGNRAAFDTLSPDSARFGGGLIFAGGSSEGQVISNVKAYEPRGWTCLHIFEGKHGDSTCSDALVVASEFGPSGRDKGVTSSGISLACTNSRLINNTITDVSENGIAVFGAMGSLIEGNSIRAMKIQLKVGISMVHLAPYDGNFSGTHVDHNVIDAHGDVIDVGVAMGLFPLSCRKLNNDGKKLFGAKVTNNILRGDHMQQGLVVHGVRDWNLTGNADMGKQRDIAPHSCLGGSASWDKPHLILHVGPPKTGTTSIQNFGLKKRKLLEQDNVYYVGHAPLRFMQQMGFSGFFDTHLLVKSCREDSAEACSKAWKSLHKVLDMHRALNHTVFLSEENFSDSLFVDNDRLWDGLLTLTERWRVSIVLTYRRHYEVTSSLYHELFDPRRRLCQTWPDSGGGIEIPSFPSFERDLEARPFFDPAAVKKRWEHCFESVSIFNFHQTGHLVRNFFCHTAATAPKACHLLEAPEVQKLHSNPSDSKTLHWDMIAVAAYKKGLLNNTTLSRPNVSEAVERHASENLGLTKLTDFPLEQLSPRAAEELLQHSLCAEAAVLPEFHASPEGKPELEAGFQHYEEMGRLASIDTNEVLNDPNWKKFFSELR